MPANSRRPLKRSPTTTLTASDQADRRHGTGAEGDGTTKLLPRRRLQCYSVACGDMPQLEFGDKIVLPPQVLLELQCLKIPTPLLFQIQAHNPTASDSAEQPTQYCSVQEFSAPEGIAYVPYWMMQRLLLEEGAAAVVASVVGVPRGTYCRLRPESASFLSLAADIGPKVLMESALRRYSVLSVDATILVEYGNERFYLRVVELKPAPVVSLCGDVDLETDFMAPENSGPKRPRSQEERSRSQLQQQSDDPTDEPHVDVFQTDSTITASTLTDEKQQGVNSLGGFAGTTNADGRSHISAEWSTEVASHRQPTLKYSLHQAQQRVRERKEAKSISTIAIAALAAEDSTAMHLRRAQLAFNSIGHRLVDKTGSQDAHDEEMGKEKQPPASRSALLAHSLDAPHPTATETPSAQASECPLCLAQVPEAVRDLHAVRCARNPACHKFECPTCHERISKAMKDQHTHCSHCTRVLSSADELNTHEKDAHTLSAKCRDCGLMFSRDALSGHRAKNECTHAFQPCTICGLAFKRKDMATHVASCANRTDKCEMCQRFVKVVDMATHACVGPPTSDSEANKAIELTALPRISTRGSDRASVKSDNVPDAAVSDHGRSLECAYCSKTGFRDAASVERHVASECRIAQSFSTSPGNNQRDESSALPAQVAAAGKPVSSCGAVEPMPVRELLQGRLRRKDDAARLVRTRFPPITATSSSNNNRSASDASCRTGGGITTKTRTSMACATGAKSVHAYARQVATKKPPEPERTRGGNASLNALSVRSVTCELSAPVALSKRQPRARLAPS